MREHAKYSECTSEDPHILWLWETLASFDDQLLANFLFFVTGRCVFIQGPLRWPTEGSRSTR